MFRLHLDVPLDMSQDEAIQWANDFCKKLEAFIAPDMTGKSLGIKLVGDNDRSSKNYYIGPNPLTGHYSNSKYKVQY